MQRLRDTIKRRIEDSLCNGDGRLWAEITAVALRKPEIGAIVGRMDTALNHHLTTVFSIASGLPLSEAVERFSAHAALVVMMVMASAMQTCGVAKQQSDLTALVLRTINQTLDEIPQKMLKG